MKKMEKIAKADPGLSQEEALAEAKKRKCDILITRQVDAILQDAALRKKHHDCFPCWTGTHLKYSGTTCTITERGKSITKEIPATDGWYEQDEFGLPFGKPSSRDNPNARYLYHIDSYEGLVRRRGDFWGDDYRRVVDCCGRPDVRFGVLGEKKGKI